jgi:hypothetical protein
VKTLILASLAISSFAQITIVRQGPAVLKQATGRTVKGVQIVGILACSVDGISGNKIWRTAIDAGYSPLLIEPGTILTKTSGRDLRVVLLRSLQIASIAVPAMISSGVITSNNKMIFSLLSAHSLTDEAVNWIKSGTPDPKPFVSALIDPTQSYPSGCISGILISSFQKSKSYKEGTWFDAVQPSVQPKISQTISYERCKDQYFS